MMRLGNRVQAIYTAKSDLSEQFGVQELCESRGGRPELSVLMTEPYGLCGRKATLNRAYALVKVCP